MVSEGVDQMSRLSGQITGKRGSHVFRIQTECHKMYNFVSVLIRDDEVECINHKQIH